MTLLHAAAGAGHYCRHIRTRLVIMNKDDTKLDEYDKTEWRDIARILKPDLTDEEYDKMWVEFQRAKAEEMRRLSMS